MATTDLVFATRIYKARLSSRAEARLREELVVSCRSIAAEDKAGQGWSKQHGYRGYTSYASLDDLAWRSPVFAELIGRLDRHAARFAVELDLDLGGRPLVLDNIWINRLDEGGAHSGHIHPHCVLSGTFYVEIPDRAGAIRFEDPRLPAMMASPPRKAKARTSNRTFLEIAPQPGMLLMWESWLRHEVLRNAAKRPRVSVSFNYRWG